MASFGDALRGYASVLNPQVAQEVAREEAQQNAQRNQLGMLLIQQRLKQMDPQYQAQVEALQNQRQFGEEVRMANGDMSKIAAAAVKYGKPELAVNLYNQQEARAARLQQAQEALELRKVQLAQTHELALQRISDSRERQLESERHNKAMEALNLQNAALNAEIKRQGLALQGIGVQLQRESLDIKRTLAGGGGLTPENAGKVTMAQQSVQGIDTVKSLVFDKDGNLNRGLVAAMNAPLTAGLPFSDDARIAKSALRNAVEAKLRLETGAAATESEVSRIMERYSPTVSDTPKSARYKLEQLQEFFTGSLAQTKGVKQEGATKVVDFGDLK